MFDTTQPFKCHSTTAWIQGDALYVNWGSNYGFGQLTFGFDRERNKLICGNEFMSKESVTEILRQMVEDSVVLSDVHAGEFMGEWVKKVRIVEEPEAGLIFASIINKQYGGRAFTKFHSELKVFEDRWENDGKIYCVFSHETQNTTLDGEERWLDIDTFKIGSRPDDEDKISVITGFTRIEEWSWVVEPINREEK